MVRSSFGASEVYTSSGCIHSILPLVSCVTLGTQLNLFLFPMKQSA